MNKVIIACAGDVEGLYLNGKLFCENYTISAQNLISAYDKVKFSLDEVVTVYTLDEWDVCLDENNNHFPKNLSDVSYEGKINE